MRQSGAAGRRARAGRLSDVPASFAVPTGELSRHPGARHAARLVGRLPDLALSTARLAEGDVVADVVLEAQGDIVTVTGTVSAPWVGECRCCLEPTGGTLVVELSEVFEPHPVDGETYAVGRDEVDLGPAVREALALALPLAPLCRDGCPGPEPGAYPVAPEADRAGDGAPADPRWAALGTLRFGDN